MRRKKHKHTRRAMAFYKVHFGIREPYKVLLDGNFIHATLAANIVNLQGLMENLLGGPVKLFTSRCVGAELRALGGDFAPAAAAARAQALHHCGHEPPRESASDCLMEQVGAANAAHWVVATQDKALQAALARVPGAPVVFASVNGIHLSEPSETARALVAGGAAAAQALPLHELATEALHDLHELRPRDEGYKKFRRKHAKGPNPLAVKAKKKRPAPGGSSKEGGGGGGGAQQRPPQEGAEGGGGGSEEGAAAKRKRKRKKGKAAGDGGGGGSD